MVLGRRVILWWHVYMINSIRNLLPVRGICHNQHRDTSENIWYRSPFGNGGYMKLFGLSGQI